MQYIHLFEEYNPVIIGYHGTKEPFEEFEQRNGTVSTIFGSANVKRIGFFFSEKPEFATQFGEHIMRCALHVDRWLDLRYGFADNVINQLVEMGVNANYLYNLPVEETWEIFDGEDASFLTDKLVILGFDGIIMIEYAEDQQPHTVYVVLDKNKIEILT